MRRRRLQELAVLLRDGENLRFSHKTLPALLYYSTKNMDALEKCHPAATMFVLKSRLFDAAPMHHGGLLKFLWAMLGPTLAIKAKGKKFLKKVDAGGLSDVPDSFGLGRPLPAKKRGAVRKVKGPKNYPPKRARALGAVRLRRAGRRAGEVARGPRRRLFLFPPPTPPP